ncbi:class I SAM-dependent methyltransferase [Ruminococcus sp.]|uniref:class I SAM-dependent methyltransferase n=1 Tax=Ruminococcus sp. TaxID=41978 RepID=UPI0025FA69DB|nr:class I SAM-dependent methyltransferase [Ruminococcus sp.]
MNKTLKYYNDNADKFILGTLNVDMMTIQKKFISYIPKGGKVLDLGCGSGRDSLFFKQFGYNVTAVDGSAEMCRQAEKNIGQPVINLTFDKLPYEAEFDGIWACASLLHVPSSDIHDVLVKIEKALKKGGYFYFSVKYGDYEGEREGRYYTDYTEKSIEALFAAIPSLKKVDMWFTDDARPERNDRWINCIYYKQ